MITKKKTSICDEIIHCISNTTIRFELRISINILFNTLLA